MIDRLKQLLPNDLMFHCVVAAAIVVAAYFLSGIVKRLLTWLGRRIFAKTATSLDDLILDVVRKNVRALMVVLGFKIAIREIRKGLYPEYVTMEQLLEYAGALVFVAAVFVVGKVVFGVLNILFRWYLDELEEEGDAQLKMTLAPLTGKLIGLLLGMVGAIVILDHFGINIGSLLVSLGVGSLAVALAAQDTLANMIAGFVIMVDRPFRVGDRIELSTGQVGDVQKIGLRSTRIVNFDNNLIVIPNAELVKGRIVNYAFPNDQTRVLLRFDLAHGTGVESVRKLLLGIAEEHPDVLRDPAPQVFVTALNDVAVQCTLVARCRDYLTQVEIEAALREKAHAVLVKEGIAFGIPQRLVQMKAQA